MGPAGVEESDVLEKDGAQVSFAEDDDVVEAFAADAAEERRRSRSEAGAGQPESHSTKGSGIDNFNEIRFEDKKGEESVNIQAEKDMTTLVKNNQTNTIKASRSSSTGGNDSVSVGADRSLSVTGTNTITVTKSDTETYKDTRTITVKGPDTLTVTNAHDGTYNNARTATITNLDKTVAKGGKETEATLSVVTAIGVTQFTRVGRWGTGFSTYSRRASMCVCTVSSTSATRASASSSRASFRTRPKWSRMAIVSRAFPRRTLCSRSAGSGRWNSDARVLWSTRPFQRPSNARQRAQL